MDVVLIGPDLVGPGPFVEVGGGGEVVEAAVPEEGGVRGGREGGEEGEEGWSLHFCGGVVGFGSEGREKGEQVREVWILKEA